MTDNSSNYSANSSSDISLIATNREMANRLNPHSVFYQYEHDPEQNKRPRFAVFLGAGASVDSGIYSANKMIEDFIKTICAVNCPEIRENEKKDEWLKSNNYYRSDRDKYGSLFEKCYPREVDRREYIESQVDGKDPSLGYIALAHLIKARIIDTIITTNFDDLVYTACTSYTDIRPVVYSLGGFASEISGTTNRPRVLKLHGDFLFSDIKNTEEELSKQDPNMSQQVQQILESYRGLVVIGYSGNDDSIIKLLSHLPNGKYLYWCVYKDEKVNTEVENLLKDKSGWIVRHEGFDKLLNEIREIIGIKDEDIFNLFEERRIRLQEEVKKFNPEKFEEFGEAFEIFTEAGEHFDKENYTKAAELYQRVVELMPDYAPAYNYLGLTLDKLNHPQTEVAQKFDKAIELNPYFAYAYNNLGFLYTKDTSKYNEAEKCFRKAIDFDDTYDEAHNNLGYLLDRIGSHQKEAESCFRKAIALNPNNVKAYNNLGILLDRIGSRQVEALKEFGKAINIEPENADSYVNLNRLLTKDSSLYQEAEKVLRAALDTHRNSFNVFLNLGVLFSKMPLKHNTAKKIFEKCIEVRPSKAKSYYYLGHLYTQNSLYLKDAFSNFIEAIKLSTNYEDAYNSLYFLLSKETSQINKVESLLRKIVTAESKNFIAKYYLGRLLIEFKENGFNEAKDEAIEIFRSLISEFPKFSKPYESLFILLGKDSSTSLESERVLRAMIQEIPDYSQGYTSLAYLLLKDTSRFSEAVDILRQASNKFPKDSRILSNLAFSIGLDDFRLGEAERVYRQAIEIDPNYPKPHNYLGILYYVKVQDKEAKIEFEKALENDNESVTALLSLAALSRKLGDMTKFNEYLSKLENIIDSSELYDSAGLASLNEQTDIAIEKLTLAIKKEPYKLPWVKRLPCFDWIRSNSRFQELISSSQ